MKFFAHVRLPFILHRRSRRQYKATKERTRHLIQQKIDHFKLVYPFFHHSFSVRNQKTRWGSCSKRGHLSFHYRILFLPEHLQDYIVVHELCHLQEMNHSSRFWALVAQAIPDYKHRRRELKTHRLW